MSFEYDKNKSDSNKLKHGIDFEEAKELWNDLNAVEIKTKYPSEDRYVILGCIGNKHWTAVITYRNGKKRIISVRYSSKKEKKIYEKNR